MNRRAPLARRTPLRRVALHRRPATPDGDRALKETFRWRVCQTTAFRCLIDRSGASCSGPLDAHHVTPKRALKRYAKTSRLDRRATLALLWNPANGVPVCRRHHDEHERARRRIPRELLPAAAVAFARALELEPLLERTYPTRGDRRAA